MKKVVKIVVIVFLVSCLVWGVLQFLFRRDSVTVWYDGGTVTVSAQELTAFADEKNLQFAENDLQTAAEDEILELVMLSCSADTEQKERINESLERYGVFLYSVDVKQDGDTALKAVNDGLVMNAPAIYYRAYDGKWIVAVGGYWAEKQSFLTFFSTEVGRPETIGVEFTGVTGYASSVADARGWLTDGAGADSTTYNRSTGDGAAGFEFILQDYMENGQYIGKTWAGLCVYDAGFAQLSCALRSYYCHTFER